MNPPTKRAQTCGTVTAAALFYALATVAQSHAEPDAKGAEFFEKKIRPLLSEQCFDCHSHKAKKIKGGLVVDSRDGLLNGGDTGAAIVPGDPEKSLLIKAVSYTDPDLQMPPNKGERKKLSDEQIALLTEWVKMGAPWPETSQIAGGLKKRPRGAITDEDRKWWAFQPVRHVTPPEVKDNGWGRNEIDAFVFKKIADTKLTPAPEAERRVLIRRVYFDMLGLPPTPEEVDAFVADASTDAYEKLIDRVLASPRYGERWARHWLDLVRYADSDGYKADDYRPNAWRYRDYVIKSLNNDKPYDLFVKEQIAGDELFPNNPDAIIATGYYRNGIYEYNNADVRGQWTTILNDITDTTSDVFFGLGMQCARCHDHKFDPILQKDYYRLQAFFAPILHRDDITVPTEAERAEYAAKLPVWEEKTADIRKQIDEIEAAHRAKLSSEIKKFNPELQALILKPEAERTPLEKQIAALALRQTAKNDTEKKLKGEEKDKYLALKKRLATFDADKPELPVAFAATDVGPVAPPTFIPKKGNDPVEPGFPTVLDSKPATINPIPTAPNSTGRRAALAEWITRKDNPLAARVIVNRVWQQHFGRGLAVNASDFGKLGEPPTHPELLDWLASRLVADGWSLKKLHRLILTSATYREGASHPSSQTARLKDPENRLLWHAPVRRLDAEQIRDAVFAVTGELKTDAGGAGVSGNEPRRSIYTRVMRNTRDAFADAFDAPQWFASAASRDTTTTPVQSLFLINSQTMLQRAKALAGRIENETDDSAAISRAYRIALGRAPSADETEVALKFLHEQQPRIDTNKAGSPLAAFLHDKIPYRDGQAAVFAPDGPQRGFAVADSAELPTGDFTIEAFVLLHSIYDSGAVRTVAAKWSRDGKQVGWAFGITGAKSRRKPQTLVMQIFGTKLDGTFGEAAIFSDQHLELNKPYFIAASVKLAGDKPGTVTFYAKDISNDDEPLQTAEIAHAIVGGYATAGPFTIGNRGPKGDTGFDGLIDEVRLSNAALASEQLLFTKDIANENTVGFWQFEPKPGVFRDSSTHKLDIDPGSTGVVKIDPRKAALTDFCHVLLNSNEFLYVE